MEITNGSNMCFFLIQFLSFLYHFSFKLPIGYCFVAGISGAEKANILKKLLQVLQEINCVVKIVTFDGHSTNFTMAKILGASFDVHSLKSEISIEGISESIILMLDAVHMLKLNRNMFASEEFLYLVPDEQDDLMIMKMFGDPVEYVDDCFLEDKDESDSSDSETDSSVNEVFGDQHDMERDSEEEQGSGDKIEIPEQGLKIRWDFVIAIYLLERKIGQMKKTNLSLKHIKWYQHKMKVCLASQVYADRVAKFLYYLEHSLELEEFNGAIITALYIKVFNDGFDIFNSKDPKKTGFKGGITKENMRETFEFLAYFESFLKRLVLPSGKHAFESTKKVGIIGFLNGIQGIKILYTELVESSIMKTLLSYQFSQDLIEMWFGMVRQHCGSNNNPSAFQFICIYKRIMSTSLVHCTENSNCALETQNTSLNNTVERYKSNIPFGTAPRLPKNPVGVEKGKKRNHNGKLTDEPSESEDGLNSVEFSDATIKKIKLDADFLFAKCIQSNILDETDCSLCFQEITYLNNSNLKWNSSQVNKDIGKICEIVGSVFKDNVKKVQESSKSGIQDREIQEETEHMISLQTPPVFNNLKCNHKMQLIQKVIDNSFKEFKTNFLTNKNDELHKNFVRSRNTKLITFQNQ